MVHPYVVLPPAIAGEDDADLARALREFRTPRSGTAISWATTRRHCGRTASGASAGSHRHDRDKAMLNWLDNNVQQRNRAPTTDGTRIPPNENYGRELMQLFSLGTAAPEHGRHTRSRFRRPAAAELHRRRRESCGASLTGWLRGLRERAEIGGSLSISTTPSDKTLLGRDDTGRTRRARRQRGRRRRRHDDETAVARAVHLERADTETRDRDADAGIRRARRDRLRSTDGNIKATVRAILTDPEFTSDAAVRTQFKEPIEQFVGPLRALERQVQGAGVHTSGSMPGEAARLTSHRRCSASTDRAPRDALLKRRRSTIRDTMADQIVNGYYDGTDSTR